MKKTIITMINRKDNSKVFTYGGTINEGTTVVLIDAEGNNHLYAESTVRKNYKKVIEEVEIEEPKEETDEAFEAPYAATTHQRMARHNIRHGYNWVVGGHENALQDRGIEMPSVEELFNEVYDEVVTCTFDDGSCDTNRAPICMKFAGKAFIREYIAYLFRKDGYSIDSSLIADPAHRAGHPSKVNSERINLRADDAEKTVSVRAFTGMLIGSFKVESEDDTTISVILKNGSLAEFDKTTGKQLNALKPRFANRIDV